MQPDPLPDLLSEQRAADEVDVWWGGYAARTMLPIFVGCVLFTALLAGLAWLLDWEQSLVRFSFYVLTSLLWLVPAWLWLYRTVAVTYRLTTRHLYIDRGFSYTSFEVIDVSSIAKVDIAQNPVERRFGVGRVRIVTEGARHQPAVLEGVFDPARLAAAIRRVQQRLPTVRHEKLI